MAEGSLVCIDSMICVWGIKRQATEGQEPMIEFAKSFIEFLDESKKNILIPSPIITEILTPVDNDESRDAIMETINRGFIVGSLDTAASMKAAEIAHKRNDWKEIYRDGDDIHKNRFKFDTLIAGIAVTKRAEVLYTNDRKLRIIASDYITCKEMPELARQASLFEGN